MAERVPIGSDHAGFALKERLKRRLETLGYEVEDVGTYSDESVDYPDFAKAVASRVSEGKVRRGVLICGTGLGMSYVANRFPKVRAAVVWNPEIAELSRRHTDSNVLVLPARFIDEEEAEKILDRWIDAPFEAGRHQKRVQKIETDVTR